MSRIKINGEWFTKDVETKTKGVRVFQGDMTCF